MSEGFQIWNFGSFGVALNFFWVNRFRPDSRKKMMIFRNSQIHENYEADVLNSSSYRWNFEDIYGFYRGLQIGFCLINCGKNVRILKNNA